MPTIQTIARAYRKIPQSRLQGQPGVLLGAKKVRRGRKFDYAWIVNDVVHDPKFEADVIVDVVRRVVLAIHRDAIRQGMKASGDGAQPKLSPWTLYSNPAGAINGNPPRLRAGQRNRASLFRGYKTGKFTDTISGSAIKIRLGSTRKGKFVALRGLNKAPAIRAESRIAPKGRNYVVFVRTERAKRGINYFYTGGAVKRRVDQAMKELFPLMLKGHVSDAKVQEIVAKQA